MRRLIKGRWLKEKERGRQRTNEATKQKLWGSGGNTGNTRKKPDMARAVTKLC